MFTEITPVTLAGPGDRTPGRISKLRALRRLGLAGLVAAGITLTTYAPAQAAERDGSCDPGEFCYFYNSSNTGSISDHVGSLANYGTATSSSCYKFESRGRGQGTCIKNNAASVWNRTGGTVRIYYNSNYGGTYQDVAAGSKANLNASLKNNNASHRLLISGSTSYAPKDDYPYRGSTTGADTWNFVKGNCTSFAAWAINGRVGVPLNNYYKGVHWGNAANWNDAARSVGVPVFSQPHAGDVAVREGGAYGHVAFVTTVNADGTFQVDEYNYLRSLAYDHRTASVGTANDQFSSFIRFK